MRVWGGTDVRGVQYDGNAIARRAYIYSLIQGLARNLARQLYLHRAMDMIYSMQHGFKYNLSWYGT
jgi:hypothetical protein